MSAAPPIRVANAPCSWGVLEFDDLEPGSSGRDRVLDEIAAAGFAGTELGDWGFLPTEPATLAATLDRRRLALLAAFVPVALADRGRHDEGTARALRTARLLAAVNPEALIVLADDNGSVAERVARAGRIDDEVEGLNAEQWRCFADGAEHVARAVRDEAGLRTVFHHHCAGYVETPRELARLLELTDPTLLGLCLDAGHLRYGGGDPLAALQGWRERIWHVHFKDCSPRVAADAREQGWDYFRAVAEGVFCELGAGEVDFSALLAELRRTGYDGWIVVEQDVLPGMGTPLQSAQRNRAYLASLGL